MNISSDLNNLGGSSYLVDKRTGNSVGNIEYIVFPTYAVLEVRLPQDSGGIWAPIKLGRELFDKAEPINREIVDIIRKECHANITVANPGRDGFYHPQMRAESPHFGSGFSNYGRMNAWPKELVHVHREVPLNASGPLGQQANVELRGITVTEYDMNHGKSYNPVDFLAGLTLPSHLSAVYDEIPNHALNPTDENADSEFDAVKTPKCPICASYLLLADAKAYTIHPSAKHAHEAIHNDLDGYQVQPSTGRITYTPIMRITVTITYELFWLCEFCDQEILDWSGDPEIVWS